MKDSMRTGVSGFVYAVMKNDSLLEGTSYDQTHAIEGLVTISHKPASNTATYFADNGPYEVSSALGEIPIDIEFAALPFEDEQRLLGHKLDKGVLHYTTEDTAPYVAIGFVGSKANGKRELVWLTKVMFAEPTDEYKTKGEKVDYQSRKLTAKAVTRASDKHWKLKLAEDAADVTSDMVAKFLTVETITVPKKTA